MSAEVVRLSDYRKEKESVMAWEDFLRWAQAKIVPPCKCRRCRESQV
jgi:hypothetical protein